MSYSALYKKHLSFKGFLKPCHSLGATTLHISKPFNNQTKAFWGTYFLVAFFISLVGISSVGVNFALAEISETKSDKGDTYEKLKVFSEIISLLESSYVQTIDSDELIDGAIRGMLKALDPHTTYLNPKSYKDMRVETSGKFGGLGIEISMRDAMLTIVSPIEDTPADRAGVLAGDKIIQIEEEPTLDMTLADAVNLLRGKPGESINITIFREGFTEPKQFKIVRDIIKVKSVKHKIYNKDIGYIKIRSFSKNTGSDLDKALATISNKGVSRLVLDLRNNPGGLLNQAVEVADRFLDSENLIVYTNGRNEDQNMRFTTRNQARKYNFPMIILVNAGSASASEIVSGALQDLGRAVILGTQTFGKGSVQTIIPLSDGSALRLTTARYYTPSGRIIQENGIEPDIIIEQPIRKALNKDGKDKDRVKEESDEKKKIRKFLREKDLKKHLKGKKDNKDSVDGSEESSEVDTKTEEETKKSKEMASLEEDLKKDYQLQQAVALLSGWDIMRQFFQPKVKTAFVD